MSGASDPEDRDRVRRTDAGEGCPGVIRTTVSRSEKSIRFGCGFLVGLVLAIGGVLRLSTFTSALLPIGIVVAVAVVCGLLAVRHGDRFFTSLRN